MQPTPAEKTPLERSLEALTHALEHWDPDTGGDVTPLLLALRELDLRFDPRKDRLSSALCVTSMKLLEEVSTHGAVGPEAAVKAVSELARGLQETLATHAPAAAPGPAPAATRSGPTLTLKAPSGGSGLSLAVPSVGGQGLGEMMVRLHMLTPQQHEQVLATNAEAASDDALYGQVAIELGFASPAVIESAQRLQSRGRGVTPPPKPSDDPWGDSPL
jgi:hypothetical protein